MQLYNMNIRFGKSHIGVKELTNDMRYVLMITGIYFAKSVGFMYVNIIGDHLFFQICSKLFQIMLLLVIIKPLLKNIVTLILTEAILLFLYLYSGAIGLASRELLLNDYFYGAVLYIPMAIAAYKILDKKCLIDSFYSISQVVFPFLLISIFIIAKKKGNFYDMTFGYLMLIPCLMFLYSFFNRGKILDLFFSMIGLGTILLYGSRGPILCLMGFILLEMSFSNEMKMEKKAVLIMLGCISIVILIIFWNEIICFIMSIGDAFSIDSRSLRMLHEGNVFTYSSGRDEIIEKSLSLLRYSPILGCGIGAAQSVIGTYPHNIFIELLLNFGYLMGGGHDSDYYIAISKRPSGD